MLSVWLIRQFTTDMVETLARPRGGARAVRLDAALKRRLGVGNSTGLGMAPFLVRHPILLNNWMAAREEALARVRSLDAATPASADALRKAHAAARDTVAQWRSGHPIQTAKLAGLRADLEALAPRIADFPGPGLRPSGALWLWGEGALGLEGQEMLLAMLLEPHGALVEGRAPGMSADETAGFTLDGAMRVGALRAILHQRCVWALAPDFTDPAQQARFWYVSEEKLEPRLGCRAEDPGAERELPLCTGRYPYAEIRDHLIADDLLPIDLMRRKLAFFGASHFDPRSDKWVRISLFRHAPYPLDTGEPFGTPAPPSPRPTAHASTTLSRPEIEALCLKVARGAGLGQGRAEEAGMAAGWLQANGLDGAAAPLARLRLGSPGPPHPTPGAWHATRAPLCPVIAGAAPSDFSTLPDGPHAGDLILAAIARAQARALTLTWDGGAVRLADTGAREGDLPALARGPEG
ncbi:MAG: hypothetical protein Kow0013_01610 [Pararhodobacter sp.]